MTTRWTDKDLKRFQEHIARTGTSNGFVATPQRRKPRNIESKMQQDVVKWWAMACIPYNVPEYLLMAFPLQGARTPQNGARMKAEGCRKGTLDMFLAVPRGRYHGLWIENKAPEGVVSDEQLVFMDSLLGSGYAVDICRTFDQATQAITRYLDRR